LKILRRCIERRFAWIAVLGLCFGPSAKAGMIALIDFSEALHGDEAG
jgi:hypothetical protein